MIIPPNEYHCIDLTIHTLICAIKKYKLNKLFSSYYEKYQNRRY